MKFTHKWLGGFLTYDEHDLPSVNSFKDFLQLIILGPIVFIFTFIFTFSILLLLGYAVLKILTFILMLFV